MSDKIQRLKVLCAGVLSLLLMVGIARFSYTPLLPIMQQQTAMALGSVSATKKQLVNADTGNELVIKGPKL